MVLASNVYAYEPIVNYKAQWGGGDNNSYETNILIEYTKINVETVDLKSNKKIWSLKDKIRPCGGESLIEVPITSFEIIDLFEDGEEVVFFAYEMGCGGVEEPVDIKYFAYYKGNKYSLRGQSVIVSSDSAIREENKPHPDYNLRNNPKLLAYMLKKWPSVSTKILF